MPVQMSSSNSRADKVGRKVRVAFGKLKGSDDGFRTLDSRKKGTKNMKSRGNSNVNLNEISSEMGTRRKTDLKKNRENEGFEAITNGSSGWKRKRIYADSGVVGDRNSGSRSKTNVIRSYMDKGKKIHRGKSEGADNLKLVNEKGLRTGISRTSEKREVPSARNNNLNQRKYAVGSVEKTHKKKEKGKKSLANDSDETEDRPKKKKRVIRLDPHDTSNKRLVDDGIANIGTSKVKPDSADDAGVEMSKNAQFRAIRPSSSIISFVEDNLLGRRRDIEFRRAGYNIELSAPLDNIPFSTGSDRERIEVPVFRNKLDFFAAAKISSSFPPPDLPEIAFAGRSNVGKSSLLNALTRQWGVVRTSDKPGLTQTINFFNLGSKQCLVDLPGYGFAYAKEEVKESWEELVKEYVSTRVGLKRVCLLVDTKWGMKPRDHELIELMERSQTKYQIVLTKTDLVFPIDVARRAMQIEENLKAKKSAVQPLMMVSSKTGAGIRSLRTVLANVARLVRR